MKDTEEQRSTTASHATFVPKPIIETGPVLIERQVLERFGLEDIDAYLTFHVACDAGPCSDWQHIYDVCLRDGGPVFSFFRNERGDEGRIVTDPDRSRTTITLKHAQD